MTKGNYYAKQLECSINLYDAVALCPDMKSIFTYLFLLEMHFTSMIFYCC